MVEDQECPSVMAEMSSKSVALKGVTPLALSWFLSLSPRLLSGHSSVHHGRPLINQFRSQLVLLNV